MICDFCHASLAGGGINRMKQHFAGVKGNVASCKKVPFEVRLLLEVSLKENAQKAKEKRGDFGIENPFARNENQFTSDDIQVISSPKGKGISINEGINKGKKKASHCIEAYMTGKTFDSFRPSIKACIQSKKKCHDTYMTLALWFYDACIPFNPAYSPYF